MEKKITITIIKDENGENSILEADGMSPATVIAELEMAKYSILKKIYEDEIIGYKKQKDSDKEQKTT